MSTDSPKPRRAVAARRLLALGASAAVLGTAADATPTSASWLDSQGLVHRVAAEGEGAKVEGEGEGSAAVEAGGGAEGEADAHFDGEGGEGEAEASAEGEGEASTSGEGEGDANASAEGEGEGEGEAGSSGEGEAEGGGSGPAPAVAQGRTLLIIDGLLGAAEDLRAAGATGADELIEQAAETAEHALDAPLAGELYEAIEGLQAAEAADGFAPVRERIATSWTERPSAARLEALPLALRTAARKYGASVTDGAVTDRTGYLEALGIYRSVRAELEALAGSGEAAVTDAAEEMLSHLEEVEPAFSGLSGNDIAAPDASLLHGAASRMELAALKQR